MDDVPPPFGWSCTVADRLDQWAVDSGGAGAHRGGDGVVRELCARLNVTWAPDPGCGLNSCLRHAFEDAAAAFAWVKRNIAGHGGDPDRILVAGHSAGAYLAMLLAAGASADAAGGVPGPAIPLEGGTPPSLPPLRGRRGALQEVERLQKRLQAENVYLQEEIRQERNMEEIKGSSPALTAILAIVMSLALFDQWRERRGGFQLIWGIGMLFYGIAAGCEALAGAVSWNEPLYRTWYLTGAVWTAGWLGLGTAFLLPRPVAIVKLVAALIFQLVTSPRTQSGGSDDSRTRRAIALTAVTEYGSAAEDSGCQPCRSR